MPLRILHHSPNHQKSSSCICGCALANNDCDEAWPHHPTAHPCASPHLLLPHVWLPNGALGCATMLAEYPQGMSFSSKVNIPHAAPKLGPPPTSPQLTHQTCHSSAVADWLLPLPSLGLTRKLLFGVGLLGIVTLFYRGLLTDTCLTCRKVFVVTKETHFKLRFSFRFFQREQLDTQVFSVSYHLRMSSVYCSFPSIGTRKQENTKR